MEFLKVIKSIAINQDGQAAMTKAGSYVYNYDVVGVLNGREMRAGLQPVIAKEDSRAYAYDKLDSIFGDGSEANVYLRVEKSSYTDAAGEVHEYTIYNVCMLEKDTGFEIVVPMKPRQNSDKVVLENLLRKQEFLAQKSS